MRKALLLHNTTGNLLLENSLIESVNGVAMDTTATSHTWPIHNTVIYAAIF